MATIIQVIPSRYHAITVVETDKPGVCSLEVDGKRVIIGGNYEFATVEAAVAFGEQIGIQFINEAERRATKSEREFTIEE